MTVLLLCNIIYTEGKRNWNTLSSFTEKNQKNGDSPVEEFIDSLDVKHQAKALRVISLLKAYGNTLREPYSKPLIDGIFELRTSLGSDTMRILYFFSGGKIVVLTNSFVKKTQKTPRGEIETARKYKEDWIERRK